MKYAVECYVYMKRTIIVEADGPRAADDQACVLMCDMDIEDFEESERTTGSVIPMIPREFVCEKCGGDSREGEHDGVYCMDDDVAYASEE